jgi:hypothetical protein
VIDIDDIRLRWSQVSPFLNERGRRLFAANEALAQGYGGITATAIATGLARSSINRGITELRSLAAGEPAISVDTKKKELIGDFKNNGRELRPKGNPELVRVHDFQIPELGKVRALWRLRHRRQPRLGQRRHERRHRCLRGRDHPALVVRARQATLSERDTPDGGNMDGRALQR